MAIIAKLESREVGSAESWYEDFDVPVGADAEAVGRRIIDRFNATLRPKEVRREFVRLITADTGERTHEWEKTNLVTIVKGHMSYDTSRCLVCGITAKRFGVGTETRDPKFAAEVYARCDTAVIALAARRAREKKV